MQFQSGLGTYQNMSMSELMKLETSTFFSSYFLATLLLLFQKKGVQMHCIKLMLKSDILY